MWRYRELLPVEPETPAHRRCAWAGRPLYEADRLAGGARHCKKLWVKDDGQNPTASLKDRASAMAVAKAQEAGAQCHRLLVHGQRRLVPRGQRRGRRASRRYIFVPSRAPKGKVAQLMIVRRNRHLRAGQL